MATRSWSSNEVIIIAGVFLVACGGGAGTSGSTGTSSDVATTGSGTDAGHEASGVPTTGGGGTTGAASTTGAGSTTGSTGVGATGSTGETGTTTNGCDFICPEDTGGTTDGCTANPVSPEEGCDPFLQNCAEGEKCAAYAGGGGSYWTSTKCVPVNGDGGPGDACTAEKGPAGGLDDCRKGAFCFGVDAMNKGTCAELCGCSKLAPTCADEAGFNCAIFNDDVLHLCLPACDPLVQDCVGGGLCVPVGDTFVCVSDGSGDAGQVFGPCESFDDCDKGLLCLNTSAVPGCDPGAVGCCSPLCGLSDPDFVCPGVGQTCVSLYEEGMAPPEFAEVGICVVPG